MKAGLTSSIVKNDAATRRPRYRNDAVFRSAERLLAARPAPPRARRPSRWLVFALGLVCGGSIAFWWRAKTESSRTESTATVANTVVARKPAATPAVQPTPAPRTPLLRPTSGTESKLVAPENVEAPSRPAQRAAGASVTPRSTRASRGPLAGSVTGARILSSALRLVGDLHGPGDIIVGQVDFVLHLLPGTHHAQGEGYVKFRNGPPSSLTLSGSWDLDSLELRGAPLNYQFALKFPTTSSGDFEGLWTGTGNRSGESGRIVLRIARLADRR
jgi:hypothetical protein